MSNFILDIRYSSSAQYLVNVKVRVLYDVRVSTGNCWRKVQFSSGKKVHGSKVYGSIPLYMLYICLCNVKLTRLKHKNAYVIDYPFVSDGNACNLGY